MAGTIQIWTDASYDKDLKKAGISSIIIRRTDNEISYVSKAQKIYCKDNNEAELEAILLGLNNLKSNDKKVVIITDSKVAQQSILSGHRNYMNTVNKIWDILDNLDSFKVFTKRGHKKQKTKHNELNNAVDLLANLARKYR